MKPGTVGTAKLPLIERRRRATLMELSETAADLFVRFGFAATTVQEVADATGVSARTFHRYFPSKADALVPFMRRGLFRYVERVAELPRTEPLVRGLCDALEHMLVDPPTPLDTALTRLVVTTPELIPVWLRAHEECAIELGPVLAPRLAAEPDDVVVRYASTSVVAANRLAVEAWITGGGEPRPYLEQCLGLLTRGVLPRDVE